MLQAGRHGWVLELAAIGLDGATTPADFADLADAGLGVMVRINHGYGSAGTLPTPDRYPQFAAACARYVARSRGCHVWIIGNEPNHELERPEGRLILPHEYAQAYTLCRAAIKAVPGHADDQVLVAGPGPWNATTTYAGNEKGDWVRYFVHTLTTLSADGCDGFALHTYTHRLDAGFITGDYFHTTPGYRHLRNEFRTYRDFMNAIPDRFRHLPVFLTETDPTTRGVGWHPGHNVGWVRAAYREIADWNRDPAHQPILSLILYRWPQVPDQPEWSISNRPGIIEDFTLALQAAPAGDFAIRMPARLDPPTILEPGNLLPAAQRWRGYVASPLGLNLRSGPTTQHTILQIVPNETALDVLAELDDWLYVDALGQRGYLTRAFVLREGAEATTPTPARPYLHERAEIQGVNLAPPESTRIPIDEESMPWIDLAVAGVWNSYGGLISHLATILQIDPAIAVAVLAMESGGRATADDGRLIIRFENHIFFEEWGKLDPDRFAQYFRFDLNQTWQGHQWRPAPDQPWQDFHGNQSAEWQIFSLARDTLNATAALRSISMGLPQIMGFNHERIGYVSPRAMFDAFQAGPHAQVIGFYDFVNYDAARLESLRSGDYMAFAVAYNGSGQAPLYAALIQDAVRAFQRLRQSPTPDMTSHLPAPPALESLRELDPELYAAWRAHVLEGFEHNREMFQRLVEAFMGPYHTTVWLYRVTFGVGLAAFLVAAGLSIYTREAMFGLVFGGVGVATFLTFFLSRPLRALEENLNFITWLGVIYNTYWTRLVYAMNMDTVQTDLAAITEDFNRQIKELLDKNAAMNSNRPGLR